MDENAPSAPVSAIFLLFTICSNLLLGAVAFLTTRPMAARGPRFVSIWPGDPSKSRRATGRDGRKRPPLPLFRLSSFFSRSAPIYFWVLWRFSPHALWPRGDPGSFRFGRETRPNHDAPLGAMDENAPSAPVSAIFLLFTICSNLLLGAVAFSSRASTYSSKEMAPRSNSFSSACSCA